MSDVLVHIWIFYENSLRCVADDRVKPFRMWEKLETVRTPLLLWKTKGWNFDIFPF